MADTSGLGTRLRHREPDDEKTRRDFLIATASVLGAVGTGLAVWPFLDSLNPAADVLAIAEIDIDMAPIDLGQRITVIWRGKPIFIDHRTAEEIASARRDDADATLIDPAIDADRTLREGWLVVVGICTHLGCIPLGQRSGEPRGRYGGYFCPCHGSLYDTSGRVRRGPAPRNLDIPPYAFAADDVLRIG